MYIETYLTNKKIGSCGLERVKSEEWFNYGRGRKGRGRLGSI